MIFNASLFRSWIARHKPANESNVRSGEALADIKIKCMEYNDRILARLTAMFGSSRSFLTDTSSSRTERTYANQIFKGTP